LSARGLDEGGPLESRGLSEGGSVSTKTPSKLTSLVTQSVMSPEAVTEAGRATGYLGSRRARAVTE
jgi:hypothetical protein